MHALARRQRPTTAHKRGPYYICSTRPSASVASLHTATSSARRSLPSTATMATENPSPEDKLRYDAAKKELMQALAKRREVDKHLVRPRCALFSSPSHSLARPI